MSINLRNESSLIAGKGAVKFVTLGCKVNQYETQGMKESLASAGFIESREASCDFVVINTCTVTNEADRENRYWIRRMRREHPAAKIVVTGCYVERNRLDLEAMPEIDLILSNHDKADIAGYLEAGCSAPSVQDAEVIRKKKVTFSPLKISNFQGKGRAFVKIQDGCNHSCSFCKVVLVRGRSRSRPHQDVVEEVVRLRDAGYGEIVFAGIQLGAYGLDLDVSDALCRILEDCSRIEGIERLRLSSIEPTDVNPVLIEALSSIPKCCPHLHIPLQSGDNQVLAAMNRRYARDFYIDLIARLKSALPDFSLTLDVMAGFPGETEEFFSNTVDLLKQVRPLKCHVFPYSERQGTRASRFEGAISTEAARARVRSLISLGDDLGRTEREHYLGRIMSVLVEKKIAESGLVQGLTSNYLKVVFQAEDSTIGRIFPVELLHLQGDAFLGRVQVVK